MVKVATVAGYWYSEHYKNNQADEILHPRALDAVLSGSEANLATGFLRGYDAWVDGALLLFTKVSIQRKYDTGS